jgi:hypothetical protein
LQGHLPGPSSDSIQGHAWLADGLDRRVDFLARCTKEIGSLIEGDLGNATAPVSEAFSLSSTRPLFRSCKEQGTNDRRRGMFLWRLRITGIALQALCPPICRKNPTLAALWSSGRMDDALPLT